MSKTAHIAKAAPGFPNLVTAALLAAIFLGGAQAAPAARENLADLIAQSELILLATVDRVSDGVTAQDVPFTEITLEVSETLKGAVGNRYRFRQFGLQQPQTAAGRPYHPALKLTGVPRWNSGEIVLVFLQQPARHTGLRSTVGLSRGKLTEVGGRFETPYGLAGLFDNLVIEADGLTPDQIEMLNGSMRAVNTAPLLALVRRAVSESWIETGLMHHAERSLSADVTAPYR
jgi:hypothetical protein